MLETLEIDKKDFQTLKYISQRWGTSMQNVLHRLIEQIDNQNISGKEDEFDQSIDEALCSEEVGDAFRQLNKTCKRIGL